MLEEINYSNSYIETYRQIDNFVLNPIRDKIENSIDYKHIALYIKLIQLKTSIKREEFLIQTLGFPNQIKNLINLEAVQLIPKKILISLTEIINYPKEERRAQFFQLFDINNLEGKKLISISQLEWNRLNQLELDNFKHKTENESSLYHYSIKNKELEIKIRLLENELNEIKSNQMKQYNGEEDEIENQYRKILENSINEDVEELPGMNYSLMDELFI